MITYYNIGRLRCGGVQMPFFKGMEHAVQGMIAMRAKQEVIANNLANANTVGFQKDGLVVGSFAELLQGEMGYSREWMHQAGFVPAGGTKNGDPGVFYKTYTHFAQGTLKDTGHPFDLAIEGDGFFSIQTPYGIRYTRNGSFGLNGAGFLVTKDGSLVMGNKGAIKIKGSDFNIKESGAVFVDGSEIDKLRMVRFPDLRFLKKTGDNYYMADASGEPVPNSKVRQGFLEGANINAVREMVEMLAAMRSFEANQKLLQAEDQMLQKSVNETGRVR